MQFNHEKFTSVKKKLLPLLVFIIAAFIYSRYGFNRKLGRDSAVFLYGGQRLADGIPPYVSVFDLITPLGPMLTGLGVIVSRNFGWSDIYTVRFIFFIVACFTAVSVYLLGNSLFQSPRIGFFSALTFMGFSGFVNLATSGASPKVLMVLLGTLSLLFTSQDEWFKAGLFGSLSFMTWQPAGIFPLVTFFLSTTQPRKHRSRVILRVLCGIGLPIVLIGAYFLHKGALYELLEGAILFNFLYLETAHSSFIPQILKITNRVISGFRRSLFPILIGESTIIYIFFWRRSFHHSFKDVLTRDRFSPILLYFPAFAVWSMIDFQQFPDFVVFLPFIAIGFGYFLDIIVHRIEKIGNTPLYIKLQRLLILGICIILLTAAMANAYNARSRGLKSYGLKDQKKAAMEIKDRFGDDFKLLSLGGPEVLVLLKRTNPNRYLFVVRGFDRFIHDKTPGGFEGWIKELEEYDPNVISYSRSRGEHIPKLMLWIESNYYKDEIGPFTLYVNVKKPVENPESKAL